MDVRINSIDYRGSFVDGPGVRTVVYLQGCAIRCEGCHNYDTWDENCGIEYDIDELVKELKSKTPNKKITISGGEPFFQMEATIVLIQKLHGMDICLYTGSNFDEVPEQILPYLKYIKVGKYKKDQRTTTTPFIGSANQKFFKLKDGKIV